MNDAQYYVLTELYQIPQRGRNYLILRGAVAEIAEQLVVDGLAEKSRCDNHDSFRLTKAGRDKLMAEWMNRGAPKKKAMQAFREDQAAKLKG